MRSSFIMRSLHLELGTTVGMRWMPEGPVWRLWRRPWVRISGCRAGVRSVSIHRSRKYWFVVFRLIGS